MDNPKEASNTRPHQSCTPCFDALWSCYSPLHQMQQYYRLGVLDNCSEKWNALFNCFNLAKKAVFGGAAMASLAFCAKLKLKGYQMKKDQSMTFVKKKFWSDVRNPSLIFGHSKHQKKNHLTGISVWPFEQ